MALLLEKNPHIEELKRITARLDLNSQIRLDSSEYMVAFVDSMPIPAWIKDVNGTMRFINNTYEKVYDIKKEEYIGHKDVDVWPKDVADNFLALDNRVLAGESVEYSVEKVPNREGFRKYDHLHVIKFPVYNGPEIIGIAGIITGAFP